MPSADNCIILVYDDIMAAISPIFNFNQFLEFEQRGGLCYIILHRHKSLPHFRITIHKWKHKHEDRSLMNNSHRDCLVGKGCAVTASLAELDDSKQQYQGRIQVTGNHENRRCFSLDILSYAKDNIF